MQLTVLIHNHDTGYSLTSPWMFHMRQLSDLGVKVSAYRTESGLGILDREHEALLLHIWPDWNNSKRFKTVETMELLKALTIYRARFPKTRVYLAVCEDDASKNSNVIYWRRGDTVLYRIPPYDRRRLFPYESVWAWEYAYNGCYGRPAFSLTNPRWPAAFIGTPSGRAGYRAEVANAVRVAGGIGRCGGHIEREKHDEIMSAARIIVCPLGWGQSSSRHWDAWRSRKPVLMDAASAEYELIAGQTLEENKHFLAFKKPADIPDIISDWTKPRRSDDLDAIAEAGFQAVQKFDGLGRVAALFGV